MAVRRVFIFTHVPKTAGTWARNNVLEQQFPPEAIREVRLGDVDRSALRAWLQNHEHEDVVIHGHVPFGLHRGLGLHLARVDRPNSAITPSCQYFTLLRDPVERANSMYDYAAGIRARGFPHPDADSAERLSRLAFLALPDQRNVQARLLAGPAFVRGLRRCPGPAAQRLCTTSALRNLRQHYGVIGYQDRLPAFLDDLRSNFAWTRCTLGPPAWQTPGKTPREDLDPATMRRIAELNRADRRVYTAIRRAIRPGQSEHRTMRWRH